MHNYRYINKRIICGIVKRSMQNCA